MATSVRASATVVAREVARGVVRRVERVEMEVAVKTEGEILEAAVVVPAVATRRSYAVGRGRERS